MNESGEGELDGLVFFDFEIFGGTFIARGTIDDGAFDPQSNSYSFDVQTDEDEAAEITVTDLAFSDDQASELEGDVDVLDENGSVSNTCELSVERVDVND